MRPFRYIRPKSLDEAIAALAAHDGAARVIAGGQSLLLAMKDRLERPEVLVSLRGVAETRGIAHEDDGALSVGAATTYWELQSRDLGDGGHALLAQVAGDVADVPVRRMGTVGGALCQADPVFDFPLAAVLADAEVELASVAGSRRMPAADFLRGPFQTALEPAELLVRMRFPADGPTVRSGFVKHRLRRFDPAIVSVGCLIDVGGDGGVTGARVACGAIGPVPARLTAVEEAMAGRAADGTLAAVARAAAAEQAPEEQANPMIWPGYRRDVLPALVGRAVAAATDGKE